MKKVKSLKRFALKAFSLFLCLSFILQQSLLVPVLASEITVAPGSDIGANITQNDNIYNITPGQIHGNTGFAHFGDFNLSCASWEKTAGRMVGAVSAGMSWPPQAVSAEKNSRQRVAVNFRFMAQYPRFRSTSPASGRPAA